MAGAFPEWIILDASTLLNLYGTGRLESIARALPCRLVVADCVMDEEALYVRREASEDATAEREPVDLTDVIQQGLIHVVALEGAEEETIYVDVAAEVDDGEAVSYAMACRRGWALATDDRKARRVFRERAPGIQLVSTLELLKYWADHSPREPDEVRQALLTMRYASSYVPPRQDPLFQWWYELTQAG